MTNTFLLTSTVPDGRTVAFRATPPTEQSGPFVEFSVGGEDPYAMHRFVGCMLMQVMPPGGVVEAFEMLRDAWEFWHGKAEPSIPFITHHTQTKVISSGVRPELVITE